MTRELYFASAVGFIAVASLTALAMPHPKPPPAPVAKADKLAAVPDQLTAKPIRTIPISRQAFVTHTPTTPELLARIAAAQPADPVSDGSSHAVSIPETATAPVTPAEAVDPPRYRHHSDVCAAHGMRRIERHHGWRCVARR